MTKCKIALGLLVSLCLTAGSFGQYNMPQSSVWALGGNKGLDFTTNPPTLITTSLSGANEGSASIADANGNLLFYTNGTKIWNGEHTVMPNGNNINGSGLNTASTTQAAVIVPIPSSTSRYYVFSMTPTSNCRLFSNIVDLSLDENRGDIDASYELKGVVLKDGLTEKMTVAKGCNNNVWLLVHSNSSPTFYAYEITENGLDTNAVISTEGNLPGTSYGQGVMKVSPDGTKIMTNTFGGQNAALGLEVYDFDPATGIVSNAQLIDQINAYGGTFSVKGSKIYVQEITAPGKVYQYNLNSQAADYDKTFLGNSGQYCDMKLAPDGKIYVASNISSMGFNGYRYFARINSPDADGVLCDFQDTVSTLAFPSGNNGALTQGLPNDVIIAQPTQTIYSVQLDTVLCNQTEFQITAQLPTTSTNIVWSDGATTVNNEFSTEGIYSVSYSNLCSNHVDTFKVKTSNVDEPVITRENQTLSIEGEYESINWYLNDVLLGTGNSIQITNPGEYEVVVQNVDSCSSSATITVQDNLSITTNESVSFFSFFPNPITNGKLTIQSAQEVKMSICNLQGQELMYVNDSQTHFEINMSELPAGIYLLNFKTLEGKLSSHKIIKQ